MITKADIVTRDTELSMKSTKELQEIAQTKTRLDASHMKSEGKATLIGYILEAEFGRKIIERVLSQSETTKTKQSKVIKMITDDLRTMSTELQLIHSRYFGTLKKLNHPAAARAEGNLDHAIAALTDMIQYLDPK